MIKKSSWIKNGYSGKQLNIKEIYSCNKKQNGKLKYLLSVDIMLGKEHTVPVKNVCVYVINTAVKLGWYLYILIQRVRKRYYNINELENF